MNAYWAFFLIELLFISTFLAYLFSEKVLDVLFVVWQFCSINNEPFDCLSESISISNVFWECMNLFNTFCAIAPKILRSNFIKMFNVTWNPWRVWVGVTFFLLITVCNLCLIPIHKILGSNFVTRPECESLSLCKKWRKKC